MYEELKEAIAQLGFRVLSLPLTVIGIGHMTAITDNYKYAIKFNGYSKTVTVCKRHPNTDASICRYKINIRTKEQMIKEVLQCLT